MKLPPLSEHWDAPFRSSPFRLRFELGGTQFGNEAPVSRFVQAFARAKQLADNVFETSRQIFGIVAAPSSKDGFGTLCSAGFTCPSIAEWTSPLWPGEAEQDQLPFVWRAFDLSQDAASLDVLLWCAISLEMAVTPKAAIVPYLVDFERNILLHVYDDRGMDVTALDREQLLGVYRARREWLLDYDRKRMAEAFGEQP